MSRAARAAPAASTCATTSRPAGWRPPEQNRANKFSITFWTWGMFVIEATIHHKDGSAHKRSYYLSYELPEDDGANYVQVQGE